MWLDFNFKLGKIDAIMNVTTKDSFPKTPRIREPGKREANTGWSVKHHGSVEII